MSELSERLDAEQIRRLSEQVDEMEAELERVKAERDELEDWIRHYKAVADKALSALRDYANLKSGESTAQLQAPARAAIAEIEGDPEWKQQKC